jgi:hypothetical protein
MTAVDENAKSLPPADGTAADIPVERVQAELAGLRKGAGVEEPALARRIGPYLRELASLGGQPRDSAALRRQLRAELTTCAARLPAEARIAVTAGLALVRAGRQAKLIGRKLWLAKALSVSPRTAQRRLDDGEALLAEEIVLELRGSRDRAATTPVGWYLEKLRVVLELDGEVIECIEERNIVATRPELDEVMAWVVIPGAYWVGNASAIVIAASTSSRAGLRRHRLALDMLSLTADCWQLAAPFPRRAAVNRDRPRHWRQSRGRNAGGIPEPTVLSPGWPSAASVYRSRLGPLLLAA